MSSEGRSPGTNRARRFRRGFGCGSWRRHSASRSPTCAPPTSRSVMEKVDQISEVKTKQLDDGRTLYLIHDTAGTEYSTTKRELAKVAYTAVEAGGHVHLEFAKKTNDRGFTNHYLNGIELIPDEQLLPGDRPTASAAPPENIELPSRAESGFAQKDLLIVAQSSLNR